jgi:Tol biopolymer transport system component
LVFAHACLAAPKQTIIWRSYSHDFQLFISNPDGSNEKSLPLGPGPNYNASFSADGKWLVFTSDRTGSADIFRAHADGSHLERLTDSPAFDDQGDLSPDGGKLVFVSTREGGTANVWLKDLKSGRTRNLTHNTAGNFRPRWSPDGGWIAFSSDRDRPRERYMRGTRPAWELMQMTAIYLIHPDGTGLRRLTPLEGSAGSPQWAHDGHRLMFCEVVDAAVLHHYKIQTRAVTLEIDTGAREVLTDGSQDLWAPGFAGDDIGFGLNGNSDQKGSNLQIAYRSGRKGPTGAGNPSWSRDGRRLVFQRDLSADLQPTKIFASRDPRYELVGGSAFEQDTVRFSPLGDRFLHRPNGTQRLELSDWQGVGTPAFDGQAAGIQFAGTNPALSSDGHTVAFAIESSPRADEAGQLALTKVGTQVYRVVTHDEGHDGFPSFSPDGMRLVYRLGQYEERSHTDQGLRIVSVADGKTVKLTEGWDNFPIWSPRGDLIAFTGFETGDYEIYTIRPDGTGLRQLTHTGGNDGHPVWSTDGRWIAFASSRKGWKDEALLPWHGPQNYGEIFVMRADGSDVRQLTDDQFEQAALGWAPAGSRLRQLR